MARPSPDVNFLQGSATAALTWVVYDIGLTLDREILAVWRSAWSFSKVLFLFSRYHTIVALGFFLMEAIGTKHFWLPLSIAPHRPSDPNSPFYAPCLANLKVLVRIPPRKKKPHRRRCSSMISRWYLGLTEVFSILAGELMILIRINAVYGWSHKVVALTLFLFSAEAVIGLVTTILSIQGGSRGLMGSTGILACNPWQANVPDVNISMWYEILLVALCTSMAVACVYLGLIIQKAADLMHIDGGDGHRSVGKMSFIAAFRSTQMTPTLHLCLRDAALYFVVIFGALLLNLVLILERSRYAHAGTPWLLATYSVASTRIFLNLKKISLARELSTRPTWSQFQQISALEVQVQAALWASDAVHATRRQSSEVAPIVATAQPRRKERGEHMGPPV
ncbi:hypothetical protein FB451DRAFT_1391696 [Mycena latifolia]|nr:hypothetical protein FB451DRAFT_1391696 [Mycena latifolia]